MSQPQTTSVAKVKPTDIAPNRRRGGDIRVLLAPSTVGATAGFLGTVNLPPGEYVSEHYHPYSGEFLYVVSGEVDAWVGGERSRLTAGEALMVTMRRRHCSVYIRKD